MKSDTHDLVPSRSTLGALLFASTLSLPLCSGVLCSGVLCTGVLCTGATAQATDQDHLRDNVFAQLTWQELGPVQSGGRIVDIAVHPLRSQVYWLAAASGGIWRTDNGGVTFQAQFQDHYSISIGDIAVAPSNGDVLYVGTGEGNNQRSSYWGDGVYKSTDGGASWRHVGLSGTEHIGRIVVHPSDPDVVYVAALGALYRGNDERGLYRTTDGGTNWQRVHDLGPDVGFVDVLLHPQHPEVVFAASYERRRRAWTFVEGGEGSRLWKSTDAGLTWQQLGNGLPEGKLGRIGIDAFAPNGDVLYTTIENLNPNVPGKKPIGDPTDEEPRDREPDRLPEASAEILADPAAAFAWQSGDEHREAQDPQRQRRSSQIGGEVYRSDDGGDSWTKTNDADTAIGGNPGYYYGQVRVDPNDQQTVYVLSVQVYRSKDGGKTWTPRARSRTGSFASGLHSDHHALWIDPRDSQHCLLGNDGGIAQSFDGGDNWDHLTHLPILQFYSVAADNRVPYRVYGGLQDNGTWGFPIHGETAAGIEAVDAIKINGGDGFQVQIDPSDPDVVYSESQFGGMLRSNLRTGERQGIKPKAIKGQQPLRFNWNTPIVISPHAPRTVYTGSQHLHRSRDRGDTWTAISPDLTTNDADKQRGNVPHCTITSISESPQQEGLLWVGTDDGKVWCSRDEGHRWQDLSDRFPPSAQGLWVSSIEASRHDAASAFVSFTGYREDIREPFVFRTDDGGENWLPISHDLPAEPVNVIRQHPRQANVLLCGTEMGAYVTIDDGAHWFPLGHGLPRVPVHDLIVHTREPHVLVGTHGRGMWAVDAALLEGATAAALQQTMLVLKPSDGVLLRREVDRGYFGARHWTVPNPFTTPIFRYVLAQDSDTDVSIEVLDVTGSVLWKKDGPKEAGYHEVTWRSERRGGFGGGAFGFGGGARGGARGGRQGGGNDGPRPGTFAVRITRGQQVQTQAFSIVDRRGTASLLGALPGDDEVVDEDAEERQEQPNSGRFR